MSLLVNIRKDFGGFCLHVSFETEHAVTGILGASGSGKSMTLKCIAGIVKPDSGQIVLNGRVLFDSEKGINLKPQQRHVGYLFQNYALFPNMTVKQNILCALHAVRDRKEKERIALEILERMRLHGLEDRYPDQLSGGQQQRTALARILVTNPELILLDEPFSALDSHLREKLLVDIKELFRKTGIPCIEVTHNRDEAYRLCGSIALMESGRILACRPTRELFEDPGSRICAEMTGCKNIVPAERMDAYSVRIPCWGIQLETRKEIQEGLTGIGVRAHRFSTNCTDNRNTVKIKEILEEPFENTVLFRYPDQKPESPDIWWKTDKGICTDTEEICLGVSPEDVLLLYDE